jgi:PAS domain-containing protein
MSHSNLVIEQLAERSVLASRLKDIFGSPRDAIADVDARAVRLLPDRPVIVWEGDPQTFIFSYVSASAEALLGYSVESWKEPGFWARTVVHPDDSSDAVAYCALATGQGRDHDFQYRARSACGKTILLHDVVHVIKGPSGVASRLRGIMVPLHDTDAPSA